MIRKFLLYYHLWPVLSSRAAIPLAKENSPHRPAAGPLHRQGGFRRRDRAVGHPPGQGGQRGRVAATTEIYTMILVHLIWADIPPAVSTILVGVCMGIMLMSLVLYAIRNIKMIRGKS